MSKKENDKRKEVLKLLRSQKIRDVQEIESSGIEVCLVNPKKFRMVPGRKTDILDCQWLQTLHYYGLLRGSFVPQEKISELRSYMRERDNILKDMARYRFTN